MRDYVAGVQQELAREIRRLRAAAGLSPRDVCDVTGWTFAKLSRVEGGNRPVQVHDVLVLGALYELEEEQVQWMLAAALRGRQHPVYHRFHDVLSPAQITVADAVEACSAYREASSFIPQLLRTPEYDRAMVAMDPNWIGDADRLALAGHQRRELLRRPDRPDMTFVLDETVFYRFVGGYAVFVDQMDHLTSLMQLRGVHVRVLPAFSGGAMTQALIRPSMAMDFDRHPEYRLWALDMPGELQLLWDRDSPGPAQELDADWGRLMRQSVGVPMAFDFIVSALARALKATSSQRPPRGS